MYQNRSMTNYNICQHDVILIGNYTTHTTIIIIQKNKIY